MNRADLRVHLERGQGLYPPDAFALLDDLEEATAEVAWLFAHGGLNAAAARRAQAFLARVSAPPCATCSGTRRVPAHTVTGPWYDAMNTIDGLTVPCPVCVSVPTEDET